MDKVALSKIGKVAYSRAETIYNSYKLAEKCVLEGVQGSFVECGVAQGSQVGAMLQALKENKTKRNVFLFDSFEGIPLCGPKDTSQPGIGAPKHDVNEPMSKRLTSSGISIGTIQQIKDNFIKWGLDSRDCVFIKGWFQDTVRHWANEIEPVAILRLDGDLYESTKVCLYAFYEKVVPGGYVIIDDYGLTGCKRAVDEFMPNGFKYKVVPNTQTVIWWKK